MRSIIFLVVACCTFIPMHGQIPVEIMTRRRDLTLDVMFFKYVKKSDGQATRWLFFNRTRAATSYIVDAINPPPRFGVTAALSYNHESLKGFAPVMVGQILEKGFIAKSGVQFALIREYGLLFTWLVSSLEKKPDLDYFILIRRLIPIPKKMNVFLQAECLVTFPFSLSRPTILTQRLRTGLKWSSMQAGLGIDFQQIKIESFTSSTQIGPFLRYEF